MISQEEKAKRYDILATGLKNRVLSIQKDLAFDLRCAPTEVPVEILTPIIENNVKYFADELFCNQDDAFFMIDYMISENIKVEPFSNNPFKPHLLH